VTGHNELRVSDRSQRTECQWQVTTNWVSVTGHNELRVSEKLQKTYFCTLGEDKASTKLVPLSGCPHLKTQCHRGHTISIHFPSCQPRTLIRAGATFLGHLSEIPVTLWLNESNTRPVRYAIVKLCVFVWKNSCPKGVKSFGMLRCAVGCVVSNVLNHPSSFLFKAQVILSVAASSWRWRH